MRLRRRLEFFRLILPRYAIKMHVKALIAARLYRSLHAVDIVVINADSPIAYPVYPITLHALARSDDC